MKKTNIKKYLRVRALCVLMAIVILTLSFTSCGVKINADDLTKGIDPISGEEIAKSSEEKKAAAISAIDNFAFNLFSGVKEQLDEGENILVSPLSAVICLALIENGMAGSTLKEVEEYFGLSVDELNAFFYEFAEIIARDELKLANSIWFSNNENRLHVKDEFLKKNSTYYNSQIYSLPFDEAARDEINKWCDHYTDGMIKKILNDPIPPETVMYLINALCFDAKWLNPYEDRNIITRMQFRNYDGSYSSPAFLSSTENVFLKGDGFIGTAKQYAGGKFSFVAILPIDSGSTSSEYPDIYDFIEAFDGKKWEKAWKEREYTSVDLVMPEFSYDSEAILNDVFSALGMGEMFDTGRADLSNIGNSENGNLYVSKIMQKTHIELDRNGTKAAAITIGEIKDESVVIGSVYIALDRPFVYLIVDNETGMPIFIGSVINLK